MNTKHPSLSQVLADHQLSGDSRFSHKNGQSMVQWPKCACGWSDHPNRHPEHVEQMWREARTITSSEQLDALPAGTVIRDHQSEFGCIFEKSADGEGEVPWWHDGEPHYDLTEINLSALLIHHPDWDTEPHTERR